MTKTPYTGTASSLDEQISLLQRVGVTIPDPKVAQQCLTFVGYYRLFGYIKSFLNNSIINISLITDPQCMY